MDKYINFSSFLLNKKTDQQSIFDIYNKSNVHLYTYSRIALFEILKFHNKKKLQNIYIPSLICSDIISSIKNLNYKIYFYEVDKQLNPILSSNTKTDILLVVNYFGFSQNLKFFRDYINSNKCITIEDNSHGFLSRDIEGKLLGTRLNYGFVSIYKSLNIYNGSILINNTNNNIYTYKLIRKFNLFYFLKKLIYFNLFNSPNLNFKIFNIIKFLKKIKNTNTKVSNFDELYLPNNVNMYENIDLKLLPFNYSMEVKRRRQTYFLIDKLLKKEIITPIFEQLNKNTIPFCYPFYCKNENLEKIHKILYKNNFVIVKWPKLPSKIKKKPSFYDNIYYVTFKI